MSLYCGQLIGWNPSPEGVRYDTGPAAVSGQGSLNSPFSTSPHSHLNSRPLRSSYQGTRRQHEPGWVARPRNAFIIFRCDYSQIHRRRGRRIRRPPGVPSTDPSLSKRAATAWKQMTAEEKEPYRIRAEQERDEHVRNNPDYRFRPQRHPGSVPRSSPSPAAIRRGLQSDVDYEGQYSSSSSTRWIHPIACNISASSSDGIKLPVEMMPVGHIAPHLNNTPSCMITESICPVSIQPHLFRNAEISIPSTATGTPTSSNTSMTPLEVTDLFAPSPSAHCEGHYEAPYQNQQHPNFTEGHWYSQTGLCIEQMPPGSLHANWYDYTIPNDYSNLFPVP